MWSANAAKFSGTTVATMIAIDDAQAMIRAESRPNPSQAVTMNEALGCILAQSVVSDVDSPPHDKALMDGYAVRAADIGQDVELEVIEEVVAGEVPTRPVESGTATRIMTGAPLPQGADAVVMVERTEMVAEDRVRFLLESIDSGTAVMRRGASVRRDQVVLQPGCELRSIEVGAMAEVGCAAVDVIRPPEIALVQTGDELVEIGKPLQPGQIRNSNGPMLSAMVQQVGGRAVDLGIARDDEAMLTAMIQQGLKSDLLLLSGGVSAGVRDLVPAVLAAAGVRQVFHKVNMRPGKPLWFGVADRADQGRCLVFGLPGNPVSSLACFWVFVAPAILIASGRTGQMTIETRPLAESHRLGGARPTYWPAVQEGEDGVRALPWQGSADLCSLASADSLIFFPEGGREYLAGEAVAVLPLR